MAYGALITVSTYVFASLRKKFITITSFQMIPVSHQEAVFAQLHVSCTVRSPFVASIIRQSLRIVQRNAAQNIQISLYFFVYNYIILCKIYKILPFIIISIFSSVCFAVSSILFADFPIFFIFVSVFAGYSPTPQRFSEAKSGRLEIQPPAPSREIAHDMQRKLSPQSGQTAKTPACQRHRV